MTRCIELTKKDIKKLLKELGRRLEAQGAHANIYVVGGAAMALSINNRRVTDDIDGIFEPQDIVKPHVLAMASAHGLPDNWLNNRASMFTPRPKEIGTAYDVPGLSINTASLRHLLAMKMAAFRPQDQDDLSTLYKELKIKTPQEAVDIVFEVYGEDYADNFGPNDDYMLRARSVMSRGPSAPLQTVLDSGPRTQRPKQTCDYWMPLARRRCGRRSDHNGPHK